MLPYFTTNIRYPAGIRGPPLSGILDRTPYPCVSRKRTKAACPLPKVQAALAHTKEAPLRGTSLWQCQSLNGLKV